MSESDIYSLFNNILDNAVEAVLRIQDPEKRIILLTVLSRNHFLFIHEENYCEEDLAFHKRRNKTQNITDLECGVFWQR